MHDQTPSRRSAICLVAVALAVLVSTFTYSFPWSAGESAITLPGQNVAVAEEGMTESGRRRRATRTPVPRATATPVPPTATQPVATQPAAAPQPTGNTGSYGCPTGEELTMLQLINDFRARNGLGALTLSPTLTNAAEFHSRDMAARNYFSHDLPGIGTWSQNISNHGYPYGTRAENIAAGYSSASQTFNQWVNSPPHRANMLNGNLTAIGIGAAYGAGSTYGTYWTNTFGSPVDSRLAC